MSINPLIDLDLTSAELDTHVKNLAPRGFRLLSLSMYGDKSSPRFAAVWDHRPGPAWKCVLGLTMQAFRDLCTSHQASGYYPVLLAATGGGSRAVISAVFEQLRTSVPDPLRTSAVTEVTLEQELGTFANEVAARAKAGWVLGSGTLYDDASNAPRVAAVWRKNTANVAWTAYAGLTPAEHETKLGAQAAGWTRLAWVAGSTTGRLLALYRDDHLGPIGHGFVGRDELTHDGFLAAKDALLSRGFYTVCLQGYGPDSNRRYAAIFVNNEVPVARVERKTGGPAMAQIDDAVLSVMKRSNIRGAALAIVQGTRLVLARGYTWAEPDYPTVQPTTCFRLASVSKLFTALGVHQLAGEGLVPLDTGLPVALPLKTPSGGTPSDPTYVNGTVRQLLEYGNLLPSRYEGLSTNVVAAFGTQLPATSAQIASYMTTQPPLTAPDGRLNDFAYFLAGMVVRRARSARSLVEAIAARLTQPLQITRLRTARSLLPAQPADEARYHSRDLALPRSVMTLAQPLVPAEYGDENLETMEASGGLSAAATDVARVLAALNARPYTPLGRTVVDELLAKAANNNGHGFDQLAAIDPAKGVYQGAKGGLLQTSQSGVWYSGNGFSTVVLWNGPHTGANLTRDPGEDSAWYPQFTEVLDAAAQQAWPGTDLFPDYGMMSFPATQAGWRRCGKCQCLCLAGPTAGACPAGGTHDLNTIGHHSLMLDSGLPYGQPDWRLCTKCHCLCFRGEAGACPAGAAHDLSGSESYRLLLDSPYNEHQPNWRWCGKCQILFFAGRVTGACPASGAHDASRSGNYRLASS